jgi:pimeloyl-ACP methyl ester carboxylesterase
MMRVILAWLLAALLAAHQAPAAAATDVPAGKAEIKVAVGNVELQVFTYRPAAWSGERMLIVMHGTLRNADEYRDDAVGMAERFGALVVAPRFDSERFPNRAYHRGGVLREDNSAAPPEEWTYALIPKLAAAMREATGKPKLPYWIIGHSAGGQFVMRMSAFQDTGAERLVAANPGSALFPTFDMDFGYGFGGLPKKLANKKRLRHYLAAPLTIYLGTADDHADEDFDDSEEAMQQGAGRHQRGLALYWSGRTLAAARGWPFAWRLVEAPGVGHDHEKMFDDPNCAVALFGEPQPAAQQQPAP